jgi:hypothetical protein
MAEESPIKRLFVLHGGQQTGPLQFREVMDRLRAGSLALDDPGWLEGSDERTPLRLILPKLGPPLPSSNARPPGSQRPPGIVVSVPAIKSPSKPSDSTSLKTATEATAKPPTKADSKSGEEQEVRPTRSVSSIPKNTVPEPTLNSETAPIDTELFRPISGDLESDPSGAKSSMPTADVSVNREVVSASIDHKESADSLHEKIVIGATDSPSPPFRSRLKASVGLWGWIVASVVFAVLLLVIFLRPQHPIAPQTKVHPLAPVPSLSWAPMPAVSSTQINPTIQPSVSPYSYANTTPPTPQTAAESPTPVPAATPLAQYSPTPPQSDNAANPSQQEGEGSSSAAQSSTAPSRGKYLRYVNPTYNFAALVPSGVFVNTEKETANRVLLSSQDGRTKLLLLSERNSPRRNATQLYQQWAREHTKEDPNKVVNYKVQKQNWFVVSGRNGDRGYYVKGILRGDRVLYMCLEYDEDNSPLDDETVTEMSRAFDGLPASANQTSPATQQELGTSPSNAVRQVQLRAIRNTRVWVVIDGNTRQPSFDRVVSPSEGWVDVGRLGYVGASDEGAIIVRLNGDPATDKPLSKILAEGRHKVLTLRPSH